MTPLQLEESRTFRVDPRERYFPTGILLSPGASYRFAASGLWADWTKVCGRMGWTRGWLTRFARVKDAAIFQLCGAVGRRRTHLFATVEDQSWTAPDPLPLGDQQLYLFANDWWIAYFNNAEVDKQDGGPMRVTVTRVG